MKFIDMHCHILPGVDDGSSDIRQTWQMLKIAYTDGIRDIIVTPHFHIGKSMVHAGDVRRIVQHLQDEIDKRGIDLLLHPGNEIYYYSGAMDDLENNKAGTLAGSEWALFEFRTMCLFEEIRDCVNEAVRLGYFPIIAHIERYACLWEHQDNIESLINSGAYIQVNADSFCSGPMRDRKKIFKWVDDGLVDFVGTDAHDCKDRPPVISNAYKLVAKKCGEEAAEKIFVRNPRELLRAGRM